MIKRRPNLSIEEGGTVSRRGKNGRRRHLGTYCRLFQTRPCHRKSMLCTGYHDFPACPDFPVCTAKPAKCKKAVVVLPPSLLQEEEEA